MINECVKFIMEDIKKNVKPMSVEEKIKKYYKILKKVGPVDGGNCAMAAIAIAKFLFEQGIVVQIVFSTPEVSDDEGSIEEKMMEQEIEIQHVTLLYGKKLFDGTGITNANKLKELGKTQYGLIPNFHVYSYTEDCLDDFETIATSNTNYSIHWKSFYEKLKESENGFP